MKLQGFIGPAYKLDHRAVDAQRCVNMYPEVIESGTGKEAEVAYLRSTPGLELVVNSGTGPIRCIEINSRGRILFVTGNALNTLEHNTTTDAYTAGVNPSAILNTSTGPVISATSDPGNDSITVFVDGDNSYIYWVQYAGVSVLESFGSFADYGYIPILNSTHVVFVDGYFIFNKKYSNQFYVSDYNSFNVDPLSFASAEGNPDSIMGLAALNRQLWIFNERSTEIWVNTGNADFPFERVGGGYIDKGCSARYSIAKTSDYVIWLDDTGKIHLAKSTYPIRICTHAIVD